MKTGIQRGPRGRIGRTVGVAGVDVERLAKSLKARGVAVPCGVHVRIPAVSSKKSKIRPCPTKADRPATTKVVTRPGERVYRVFVQDVGKNGYSCSGFGDVSAKSPLAAVRACNARPWLKGKLLPLPFDRQDLWPDGQTGLLPKKMRVKKPRVATKMSAQNRRAIIHTDAERRERMKTASQRIVIEVTKSGARSAIVQNVWVDPKTGREHFPSMRQATKRDLARLVPDHLLPLFKRPVLGRNPKHGVIGHTCAKGLPCWPFGGPGDPDEDDGVVGPGLRVRRRRRS